MSSTSTVPEVIELLRTATLDPAKLAEAIKVLQRTVWTSEDWESGEGPDVSQILKDLAYDLDYFEPDPALRAEDPSYIAEDRATQTILRALAALALLAPHGLGG